MFLLLDALSQRFGRVAWNNRNPCLYDQRSAIKFFSDKMHGRAMLGIACFEYALVRMQTLVFGQQGWMDIQQSPTKMSDKSGGEDAHETCEDDQIWLERIQARDHRCVKTLAVGVVPVIEYQSIDAGTSGPFQPVGIRPVAQHGDNVAVLSVQIVNQRLQVAA